MKSRFLITAGLASLAASTAGAQISEPDTVFYGKVLHHGGGEPHTLTSGTVNWRILPPGGGEPVTVKAALAAWQQGEYSYSVRVPRHIAVSGLPEYSVAAGLPVLADGAQRYRHADISVNGRAARIADPAALSFAGDGTMRADFVRVDIIADYALPDADGDGLPDWWEEKYGLDAEIAAAVNADADGDGLTDRAEYAAGSDPSKTGEAPQIAGSAFLTIPESGKAALLLKARDADTPAALLRYMVVSLPGGVSVTVRDGMPDGRSDRPVTAGGVFTQAEIDAGRVVFAAAGNLREAAVQLKVSDEVPGRDPAAIALSVSTVRRADLLTAAGMREGALPAVFTLHHAGASPVAVSLRAPSSPADSGEMPNPAAYAASWVPQHGADEVRVFVGSPLNDALSGSGEGDVLCAGAGSNTLRGYAGADRFVFTAGGVSDTVADFSAAERDVLDLSALLTPVPGRALPAYLSLQAGPVLRVDADGDGSGFTDAVIKLNGATLPSDIDEVWDAGLIDAGSVVPRTTLFVSAGAAGEEGPTAGRVTIRRRGDASHSLTVPMAITGTAISGTDYVPLPVSVTFAPGEKIVTLPVIPLADDTKEPEETVEIALMPGSDYQIGTANATVTISDMPTRVWLEVAERIAFKDPLSPAQIIVRRSGSSGATLTAVLQTSGRALAAVDYRRPPATVTFNPGQDAIVIEIAPLSTATLTAGCEDVILNVKSDPAYLFGITPQARVLICERPQTIAAWRAQHQPGYDPADEAFFAADADGDGFNGLMEFALNLNPAVRDSGERTQTKLVTDGHGLPGLEYCRWPAAPEIRSEVWQSSDLQNWQPLTDADSTETSAVLESDGLERVRRFMKARPTSGKVYLRLKVIRQ